MQAGGIPRKRIQKFQTMQFKDFDVYQKKCKKTAVYPKIGKNFVYPVFGLVGETGEVAEKIKKLFRDDKGKLSEVKKQEIVKELGDVMWYLAQLSTELGLKLSDVLKINLEKLSSRKLRGKLHGSGDNR
jgi:NTP pyrophosphatase (non-canonical NTP hydrolase)